MARKPEHSAVFMPIGRGAVPEDHKPDGFAEGMEPGGFPEAGSLIPVTGTKEEAANPVVSDTGTEDGS